MDVNSNPTFICTCIFKYPKRGKNICLYACTGKVKMAWPLASPFYLSLRRGQGFSFMGTYSIAVI